MIEGGSLELYIEIVYLDVPFLLTLREFRSNRLFVDYLSSPLHKRNLGWSVKLRNKNGQFYWDIGSFAYFYSRAENERLHRHFFHPSSIELYDLSKRPDLTQATPDLSKLIDDVSQACVKCKEFSSHPFQFRASMPVVHVVYNQKGSLDLVWLNGDPVLHVVGTHI